MSSDPDKSALDEKIRAEIDRQTGDLLDNTEQRQEMSERKRRLVDGLCSNTTTSVGYLGITREDLRQTPEPVLEELVKNDPHANAAETLDDFDTGVFDEPGI